MIRYTQLFISHHTIAMQINRSIMVDKKSPQFKSSSWASSIALFMQYCWSSSSLHPSNWGRTLLPSCVLPHFLFFMFSPFKVFVVGQYGNTHSPFSSPQINEALFLYQTQNNYTKICLFCQFFRLFYILYPSYFNISKISTGSVTAKAPSLIYLFGP